MQLNLEKKGKRGTGQAKAPAQPNIMHLYSKVNATLSNETYFKLKGIELQP